MKLTDIIGRQAKNHPLVIVIVISIITIALLFPLSKLEFSTDLKNFEPKSKIVRANRTIEKGFSGATSYTGFISEAKDGNIFKKEILLDLERIEKKIKQDKKVKKYLVPNPSESIFSLVGPIKVQLAEMGTSLSKANQDQINQAVRTLFKSDKKKQLKSFVSDDLKLEEELKAKVLMAQIKVDKQISEETLEDIELEIAEIIEANNSKQIKTYTLSETVFRKAIDDGAKESQPLFLISLAVIIIVLSLTFRTVSDVVLSLLALPMVFIITFGLVSLFNVTTSIASFFAPILILGLGIDYGIHILLRYREERYRGESPGEATYMTAHFVGIALVLTTITTAAAFFSNIVSDLPGVRGFGAMVGLGVISAYVVMAIFLPSLKLILDRFLIRHHWERKREEPKVTLSTKRLSDFLGALTKVSIKHPYIVIILTVIGTAGAIYGATQVESKFAVREMAPKKSPALKAMDFQDDNFSSSSGVPSSILLEGDVTQPKVLEALSEVTDNMKDDERTVKMNGDPKVQHIGVYVEVLTKTSQYDPRLAFLKLTDKDESGFPDTKSQVEKAYDYLYENGLGDEISARDIKQLIHQNKDGNYDRAQVKISSRNVLESGAIKEVRAELVENKKPLNKISDVEATVTGELIVGDQIADKMTATMLVSMLISLLITALVLVIVFFSFKYGLVALVPVCLVAVWTIGSMYLLKYDLNVLTVSIAAIAIGLGIDYSIHITQRYREELMRQNDIRKALTTAVAHTGAALLSAAATTMLAFGVLAFSDMDVFRRFGIMGGIMIAYSFIAAVLILPVLLSQVDRFIYKD